MPEATPTDRAAAGRARLAARARSVSRIRRRVAAATLASFALAWALIAHGGAMGAATETTTTTASSASPATTGTTATTTSSTDTTNSSGTSSTDTTNSSSDDTSSPTPVTTAQS